MSTVALRLSTLVLLTGLILSGCRNSLIEDEYKSTSRVISSEGGSISLSGLTATFPAGALAEDSEVILEERSPLHFSGSLFASRGGAYEVSLDAELLKEVLLTFRYDEGAPAEDLCVLHFPEGANGYTLEYGEIDTFAHTISVTVDSFSPVGVVENKEGRELRPSVGIPLNRTISFSGIVPGLASYDLNWAYLRREYWGTSPDPLNTGRGDVMFCAAMENGQPVEHYNRYERNMHSGLEFCYENNDPHLSSLIVEFDILLNAPDPSTSTLRKDYLTFETRASDGTWWHKETPENLTGNLFVGTDGWQHVRYDLSEFSTNADILAGTSFWGHPDSPLLKMRILFHSDDDIAVTNELPYHGAYIDNLRITRTSSVLGTVVPEAPTDLHVIETGASDIELNWTDNSDDESGFVILRSPGEGKLFRYVGEVSENVTEFFDDSALAGQSYFYIIRARNANGDSEESNTITVEFAGTSLTLTEPHADTVWTAGHDLSFVRWENSAIPEDPVVIDLYNGDVFVSTLREGWPNRWNPGEYQTILSEFIPSGIDYTIRIYGRDNPNVFDVSSPFEIFNDTGTPMMKVSSPSGGTLIHEREYDVIWTEIPAAGDSVSIQLYRNGSYWMTIDSWESNDGVYRWSVPSYLETGGGFSIRVTSNSSSLFSADSQSFSIGASAPPAEETISFVSPLTGASWQQGMSNAITWIASSGTGSSVSLQLYENGVLDRTISSSTSNDGRFDWFVPQTLAPGNQYSISIVDNQSPATAAASAEFSIQEAPTTAYTAAELINLGAYALADYAVNHSVGGEPAIVGFHYLADMTYRLLCYDPDSEIFYYFPGGISDWKDVDGSLYVGDASKNIWNHGGTIEGIFDSLNAGDIVSVVASDS